MKKSFLIVLGLVIAFASLFVSCNDDNDIVNDDKEVVICNVSISKIGDGSVCFKDYSETAMAIFSGNTVTVIATPGESNFTGWFIGDSEEPVSTEATYTFVVTKNVSLVAKFNKWPSVSIRSGGNGTVSFENSSELSQYIQIGDEVTVVATPNEKYEFIGWSIGDSDEFVSTDVTYTFTVNDNLSLVAQFNKCPVVYIYSSGYGSSGANGTVSFEESTEKTQYFQTGTEVVVVATPNNSCEFIGWFVGNSNEIVSTNSTYIFIIDSNISLNAKFDFKSIGGHKYVDLGLPSGIKWANYNVGATTPEEYGGYYAWGEIEEKENYSYSSYKFGSKYDSYDNLEPEDDVAHVKWGGGWRIPTKAEQTELRTQCTWRQTSLNGVNGYRLTGPNGNSIFLPAAGYRCDTDVECVNSEGFYWSSSLSGDYRNANYIMFCIYNQSHSFDPNRRIGYSVRPVCE